MKGCGKYINYDRGSQLTHCGDFYVDEERLCKDCYVKERLDE